MGKRVVTITYEGREFIMVIKVILLLVFFAVMLGIGFYSRKHATDVNGFVLGGRWLVRG